jgi:hypothetical protein
MGSKDVSLDPTEVRGLPVEQVAALERTLAERDAKMAVELQLQAQKYDQMMAMLSSLAKELQEIRKTLADNLGR